MKNQSIYLGIIVADSWDEKGASASISLHTTDEQKYLVAKNQQEKELALLIHSKVEITGKVRTRIDGKKVIKVTDFNVLVNSH